MHSIDISRQRYLDMIHRYLQGHLDYFTIRTNVRSQWAAEREAVWPDVWQSARVQRCLERPQLEKGTRPLAEPSDPRRSPRMVDRLCNLCIEARKEEPFRASVAELLYAYHCPGSASPEARFVDYPPCIPVFERPLIPGSDHWYPCTVADIRKQLALVPEYDLEGLWAIGLSPLIRDKMHAYATYYRSKRPMWKPVILLYSFKGTGEIKLHRSDPGYIKHWFRVECSYGMEIECMGSGAICHWPAESGRRYMVEHVLLHEIGHHVQYQQRWRADLRGWLPSRIHEQFADAYALRYERERKE